MTETVKTETTETASTETPSSPPPAASGGKGAPPAATRPAPRAAAAPPRLDEHLDLVAAPDVFRFERRNKAHQAAEKSKALGPRKVEITHGKVLCGNAVVDKKSRARISEDAALVGDIVTLPGIDAVMLVRNGVAKFADLPEHV